MKKFLRTVSWKAPVVRSFYSAENNKLFQFIKRNDKRVYYALWGAILLLLADLIVIGYLIAKVQGL